MPRTPLTRERILRAAIDLADTDGLDALSMRKLAKAVGVEAMSLYNHVANKDDLLDGIVDLVVAEIYVPRAEGDWRAELRHRATSAGSRGTSGCSTRTAGSTRRPGPRRAGSRSRRPTCSTWPSGPSRGWK